MDVILKDKIKPEGILRIYKVMAGSKRRELIFYEENIITLLTKQFLLSGIYTPAVSSDPVNTLHVGTGGTVDPAGLFPKTEDQTWTNLNTSLLSVPTTHTEDLTVPQTTFLADVDESLGNGSLISEAGLFRTAGAMFNVKTFPGIPKTSDFSLHFSWTIRIA
jgi:hypothetical protein